MIRHDISQYWARAAGIFDISDDEADRICEYVEAQTNPFAGGGAFQKAQALFVEVWETTDWWTDANNA